MQTAYFIRYFLYSPNTATVVLDYPPSLGPAACRARTHKQFSSLLETNLGPCIFFGGTACVHQTDSMHHMLQLFMLGSIIIP